MGCIQSRHSRAENSGDEEYIETLTLKRQVSKKSGGNSKNLQISISVIADPLSSEDEATSSSLTYKLQKSSSLRHHGCLTTSFAEGRRFAKFPNMVGYKVCDSCQEPQRGVLKMVAPELVEKEMCRKCSVHRRKESKKRKPTNLDAKKSNLLDQSSKIELSQPSQMPLMTSLTPTVHGAMKKMDIAAFASLLALTALDLTAPASDAILKNRKNTWIQLAGHPGGFAPAGPNTIWKKRYTKDNNETEAYESLMEDVAHDIVPVFYREVEYNSEYFIEIEDLLQHFTDPNIMDVKMGTRTFLESEVTNTKQRRDLYDKMVALDPEGPTAEEKQSESITKLRYMLFREQESSTADFGFRIEALRMSGEPPTTNLKRVKTKEQIHGVLSKFLNNKRTIQGLLLERLEDIRQKIQGSSFFMSHELIGSSLLVMYDRLGKCGIWVIDFSKTNPVGESGTITHRLPWSLGNHEDGFLFGLDNLIQFFSDAEIKEEFSTSITSSQPTPDTPS